jgi:hypothetical protein
VIGGDRQNPVDLQRDLGDRIADRHEGQPEVDLGSRLSLCDRYAMGHLDVHVHVIAVKRGRREHTSDHCAVLHRAVGFNLIPGAGIGADNVNYRGNSDGVMHGMQVAVLVDVVQLAKKPERVKASITPSGSSVN